MELDTLKIIIVGEGGVGKSSLLDRYVHGKFDDNCSITKGIEFFSKKIKYNGNNREYNAIFWDIGGQAQFRFMLPNFITGAIGAVLAFDLTRFSSLIQIEAWINELTSQVDLPILLVGTKYDLDDMIVPSLEDYISEIIKSHEKIIGFIKTSAKNDINVRDTFSKLIGYLLDHKQKA